MSVCELIHKFKQHDRHALAKIITLVESNAEANKLQARAILANISLSATSKTKKNNLRLAISGPPGVGKSTFINLLGKKLIARGLKLAILPIDPASELSRGSILADKTRMSDLVTHPDVYIRPSSSGGALGGVNAALSDVIYVVEAFGFDCVIIETVGVGQAETLAYSLVDFFILLTQPGAGDSLQAMKKGILERADFILVNKADGDLQALARQNFNALNQSLAHTHVAMVSAHADTGIDEFINILLAAQKNNLKNSDQKRHERLKHFISFALKERLWPKLLSEPVVASRYEEIITAASSHNQALGPMLDLLSQEIITRLK
jgi:LAO/AO transport system kinase